MSEARTLEQMKAEFAARGGAVKVAPEGVAYGVSAEADKAKRLAERDRLEAERSLAECERNAERYAEQTREAYHVGGSRARDEVVSRWRF